MIKNKKQRDPFTNVMIFKLWWPAMISSIGLSFGDMADALVVGQKMGETGLAAISICLPIYMVINVFIYGLGTGGSVRFSRLMGEGNPKAASDNFNHMLQGGLILGILLAVLGNLFIRPIMFLLGTSTLDGIIYQTSIIYGRLIMAGMPFFFVAYILNYYLCSEDNERLATIGFTVGNIMDILFNILLVLVMDLGVQGAAISTILGQIIAIVIYMMPFLSKKEEKLKIQFVSPDLKEVFECFCNGFSSSVQFIWQMFFFIIVNNVLMRLYGENGVAVFDVLQNMSYMVMYLYEGTVKAMQPVVSTFKGEQNFKSMKDALKISLKYGNAAGLILVILISVFPQYICQIFGINNVQALEIGCIALRTYCVGALIGGTSVILQGYEQACEFLKDAYLISTLRGAAVLFPVISIFASIGKLYFWCFFPITEVISLLIYLAYKKYFSQRQRIKNEERVYRKLIENTSKDLQVLMSEIELFCEKWEATMKQSIVVSMVVEEVCLAIINKGFEDKKKGYIQLTLISLPDGEFEFHIRDNAVKFNPFLLETKKASVDEEFNMDAMGILMIKKKVKYFYYRQYQGFNTLIIRV